MTMKMTNSEVSRAVAENVNPPQFSGTSFPLHIPDPFIPMTNDKFSMTNSQFRLRTVAAELFPNIAHF
jgi:hypothetical protein